MDDSPQTAAQSEQASALTKDKHRARHRLLHDHLDELLADFMAHAPRETHGFFERPIGELVEWSQRQTIDPVAFDDDGQTRPTLTRREHPGDPP